MNEDTKDLLTQVGFRIFGNKIVAGDFGSSGNATLCAVKLIELVVTECANFVDAEMSLGGVDGRSLKEHFGVEE